MAKINHFLAEYKDSMERIDIKPGNSTPSKITIKRFIRLFKNVDDSRLQGMIDYELVEILLITFLAVLGNASTWAEIARFAKQKQKWLKKFLKLKNGIPSHDTFRRVFSLIDTKSLQQATVSFLIENLNAIKKSLGMKEDGYRQICVDGKEQKGTGRKYNYDEKVRNLQTLHVYDASNEICLYSEAISKKTNEIPVAQEILKTMDLKKAIVTFDALHTQKDTIRTIVENGGDYVGGLKGNQGILHDEAVAAFPETVLAQIKGTDDYYETSEKAHGKLEIRRYYLKKAKHRFNGIVEWQNLRNFICYQKYTYDVISGVEKTEMRYYITSLRDVRLSAEAIRGHWGVENNLHWHLDYSFGEDFNYTMDKTAFHNYSLINKMVLSLCKLAQPLMEGKPSIRIIRKMFGWNYEENLAYILSCFDESTIAATLESTSI